MCNLPSVLFFIYGAASARLPIVKVHDPKSVFRKFCDALMKEIFENSYQLDPADKNILLNFNF